MSTAPLSSSTRSRRFPSALLLLSALLLSGCNGIFFQPDRVRYFEPAAFGLWHEEVRFTSADGTPLHGWFLPARPPVKGVVVHFHGNAANISNHLYGVRWLPAAGYSVFLFDYRGYGQSGGEEDREGSIADGVAAINLVAQRPDVDPQRVFVFGQSLGGALAIASLAQAGPEKARGLIVEGSFASYKEVVRLILDDSWFTWLFQYPFAYLFFSDTDAPVDYLPQLAQVPLLVVHGERDQTVPPAAGRQILEAFPGVDGRFWSVPAVGHMQVFGPPGSPWRRELVSWMDAHLPPGEYTSRVRPQYRQTGSSAAGSAEVPRILPQGSQAPVRAP